MSTSTRNLIAAVAAICVTMVCHGQSEKIAAENRPSLTVKAVPAEKRSAESYEEVVGTVQSRLRAEISPKVSAVIERMLVEPGTVVSKSDLLVQLDDREIRARLEQAQATLDQADKDLKRFTELLQNGTVTQAEFDAVQARQRVAAASRDEAATMLDYTRIVAPYDGVITRKLADVGDLATPGRRLLMLEQPNVLRLEAHVPEALIQYVKLGQTPTVRIDTFAEPIPGRVSEISPAADPASRTFLVKVELPPMAGLRMGQFGRLHVPVPGSAALRVPRSAVLRRGQMEIAFVVLEGKAHLRLVKTGKHVDGEVELLSGVEPGEQVIVDHLSELTDGQSVQVQ